MRHADTRAIGIKVGATTWNEFFGHEETLLTAGLDVDLWRLSDTTRIGLYADTAGVFEQHTPYSYYGGGIDLRQYLSDTHGAILPYLGVGAGYYAGVLHDQNNINWNDAGGKAFLGLEMHCGAFLEAEYTYLPKQEGRDMSRFGLSIGFRF